MSQSKPKSAPVVVMRPFPDGAGYAYDMDIDDSTLAAITRTWSSIFHEPGERSFLLTLPDGRYLLGEKCRDTDCLDPKARDRHPTVMRAALLKKKPGPAIEARLRRLLEKLPLPRKAGPQKEMRVLMPERLSVPEPILAVSPTSFLWSILLLVGLLAIELLLTVAMPPAHFVAWFVRILAFAGAFWLVLFLRTRMPTSQQFTEYEQNFLGEETGGLNKEQLAEDETTVVIDGEPVRNPAGKPEHGRPSTPRTVSETKYASVVMSADLVLLRGQEEVEWARGQLVSCDFFRCYRRGGNRWYLHLAQWQRRNWSPTELDYLDVVQPEESPTYRENS